jgi:hypothetical protein
MWHWPLVLILFVAVRTQSSRGTFFMSRPGDMAPSSSSPSLGEAGWLLASGDRLAPFFHLPFLSSRSGAGSSAADMEWLRDRLRSLVAIGS